MIILSNSSGLERDLDGFEWKVNRISRICSQIAMAFVQDLILLDSFGVLLDLDVSGSELILIDVSELFDVQSHEFHYCLFEGLDFFSKFVCIV